MQQSLHAISVNTRLYAEFPSQYYPIPTEAIQLRHLRNPHDTWTPIHIANFQCAGWKHFCRLGVVWTLDIEVYLWCVTSPVSGCRWVGACQAALSSLPAGGWHAPPPMRLPGYALASALPVRVAAWQLLRQAPTVADVAQCSQAETPLWRSGSVECPAGCRVLMVDCWSHLCRAADLRTAQLPLVQIAEGSRMRYPSAIRKLSSALDRAVQHD